MINIEARTADDAWRLAVQRVKQEASEQESRNFKDADNTIETLELLHAAITVEDPRQRIVFGRPINPAFAIAEIIWILAGCNDVDFLTFWNPRMKTWCDAWDAKAETWLSAEHAMRGAYGARLGSRPIQKQTLQFRLLSNDGTVCHFDQLRTLYKALRITPYTRQAILQIWNGVVDIPNPQDGSPRSKDVPCNLISDLKVRDGKLHWMQTMRSNDLVWGTPYNFIQWMSLQEIMAGWLGLEVGQFTLSTSSLHVYQNHYEELDDVLFPTSQQVGINGSWETEDITEEQKQQLAAGELDAARVYHNADGCYWTHNTDLVDLNLPHNVSDLRIEGYENWEQEFSIIWAAILEFPKCVAEDEIFNTCEDYSYSLANVAVGYRNWLWLLCAEAMRRKGMVAEAQLEAISKTSPYYRHSWLQWRGYVETT